MPRFSLSPLLLVSFSLVYFPTTCSRSVGKGTFCDDRMSALQT
jgi:hypothetical protein